MSAAGALLAAAGFTTYAGLSLFAGNETRKSLSPFEPMPVVGLAVMALGLLVLLPAAGVVHVVARRHRIAERLGLRPPGEGDDPPAT